MNLWQNGTKPEGTYTQELKVKNDDGESVATVKQLSVELTDDLQALVLTDYAEDLERSNKGKRRLQLEHIKDELRYPWLDLRVSYHFYIN